jgi:Ni,Fe-hydrogenase I small subunit
VIPQPADDTASGPFSRLFLNKQFHGDLEATSKGQMLGADTAVQGSGGYVALELVSGTLNGRRGSFILQHSGFMTKGDATMIVTVVPDSGTEQLSGLAGKMTIIIADGKHSYAFDYTFGAVQQ